MATYKATVDMSVLRDGDTIQSVNLGGAVLPMVKLHFIGCNLVDVDLVDGLHTHEGCLMGKSEPINETPLDPFEAIKEQARNKLLEVKPLAYENPLAVKVALSEAFTPEEFNGVMEAQ